jgi:hypothetical protein
VALSHATKVFGINDAAIYKLSTDPSGTPPTYGAKVDVQGVKSMEATLATDTKELRGDNSLLAADSVLKTFGGKLLYAKWNFDVWTAITTMTSADSGSTPNQITKMTLAQTDSPVFGKIEAQSRQVDYVGGDLHLILYKAMPGNLLAGFMEENYREQSMDFVAVPLIGTIAGGPALAWFTALVNETAVAIV